MTVPSLRQWQSVTVDPTAHGRPEVHETLFSRRNDDATVTYYFSPDAADVAKLFSGKPCKKPLREGLGFAAGHDQARALFEPPIGDR